MSQCRKYMKYIWMCWMRSRSWGSFVKRKYSTLKQQTSTYIKCVTCVWNWMKRFYSMTTFCSAVVKARAFGQRQQIKTKVRQRHRCYRAAIMPQLSRLCFMSICPSAGFVDVRARVHHCTCVSLSRAWASVVPGIDQRLLTLQTVISINKACCNTVMLFLLTWNDCSNHREQTGERIVRFRK